MNEHYAFGPNLRRLRVQRGITLEQIAASTKVHTGLWAAMERNDFSRWPSGIYAREFIRAYAIEIGIDPVVTVDEFCRWFPHGDRRAERIVREQAALMGHDLRWKDDLLGLFSDEDRRADASTLEDLPPVAFTTTGRIVAAAADLGATLLLAAGGKTLLLIPYATSLALATVLYHSVAMVAFGCTPMVWAIETYLANHHPSPRPAGAPRFLRLLSGSKRNVISNAKTEV